MAQQLQQTTVYLNPAHMKALDKIARAQGLRASHLMRVAIAQYLATERRKQLSDRALLVAANGPTSPARQAVAADED